MVKVQRKTLLHRTLLLLLCLSAFQAHSEVSIRVGALGLGNGGANPVSVPPINPLEYEVVWLPKGDTEWSFAATPGVFYGLRTKFAGGIYLSGGAGLVINANGMGPGIYTALGHVACGAICFNMELKQAVGVLTTPYSNHSTPKKMVVLSPYAIRIGFVLWRN